MGDYLVQNIIPVNVEVVAPDPQISLSPTELRFGNVNVSEISELLTATIRNTGNVDIHINKVQISERWPVKIPYLAYKTH